jgi:3-oxoadipate enol-lactonase
MPTPARRRAAAAAAVVAAGVGVRPPAGRRVLRSAQPIDRMPPVPPEGLPPGRVVTLPERGEVFIRDTGPRDGRPPALLLHGWTATADINFLGVYGPVAETRRVIAIDHRGHGRGMRSEQTFSLEDCADDAAVLLDLLGIPEAIVVGYSMGGPVAMLLARRRPDLVAGLVVQATALEWSGERRERLRWRGLALLELGMRLGTGESMVARALRDLTRARPELLPLRPWLASEFRRGDPTAITDAGRALARYDARPWAAGLGKPAVAVVTTRDGLVPPDKQRALAAALDAEVVEFRADHEAPLSKHAAYGRVTADAIDAVEAQLAGAGRLTAEAG